MLHLRTSYTNQTNNNNNNKKENGNTPAQQAEFDWLLYNKPLEYAQLVLGEEIEHYFPLAVTTADWKIKPL